MATGIISGIGNLPHEHLLEEVYDVRLVAVQDGVNNWQPYSTAGTPCYVYDYDLKADFPNADIDTSYIYECLLRGNVTKTRLEEFSWINALEVIELNIGQPDEKKVIRFYCFNGQPTFDIDIKLIRKYTSVLV